MLGEVLVVVEPFVASGALEFASGESVPPPSLPPLT